MTAPLRNLEERIAKLEEAADGVREATREAHEATKLLRRAEKDVRDLLKTDVRELVDEAISDAVRIGLEGYSDTIRKAQDEAFDRVGAAFEELARIYLEGSDGKPSIPELVEQRLAGIRAIRKAGPR